MSDQNSFSSNAAYLEQVDRAGKEMFDSLVNQCKRDNMLEAEKLLTVFNKLASICTSEIRPITRVFIKLLFKNHAELPIDSNSQALVKKVFELSIKKYNELIAVAIDATWDNYQKVNGLKTCISNMPPIFMANRTLDVQTVCDILYFKMALVDLEASMLLEKQQIEESSITSASTSISSIGSIIKEVIHKSPASSENSSCGSPAIIPIKKNSGISPTLVPLFHTNKNDSHKKDPMRANQSKSIASSDLSSVDGSPPTLQSRQAQQLRKTTDYPSGFLPLLNCLAMNEQQYGRGISMLEKRTRQTIPADKAKSNQQSSWIENK